MSPSKTKIKLSYCTAFNLIAMTVLLMGLFLFHNYKISDQILEYYNLAPHNKLSRASLFFPIFDFSHPHYARSLVHYPLVWASSFFHMDIAYDYYVFLLFIPIFYLFKEFHLLYFNNKNMAVQIAFFSMNLFLLLSFFMNGRGVFINAGFLAAIVGIHKFQRKNLRAALISVALIIVSLFFSASSSGGILTAVSYIIVSFCMISLKKREIFILFLLSALLSYTFLYKNISFFYEGTVMTSIMGLLSHGYGAFFLTQSNSITLTLVAIYVCSFLYFSKVVFEKFYDFFMKKNSFFDRKISFSQLYLIPTSVILPSIMGLFGYGILSMVSMPSIIILSVIFQNFIFTRNRKNV